MSDDTAHPPPPPSPDAATAANHDVVPPSDNPLRGWRRPGAWRLNPVVWGRDLDCNPVLAYLATRRRGNRREDVVWTAVWGGALLLNVVMALANPRGVRGIILPQILLLPVVAGITTAIAVSMRVRSFLSSVSMAELSMTPVNSTRIAQGISVGPIAVQGSLRLYYVAGLLLLSMAQIHQMPDSAGWLLVFLFSMFAFISECYSGRMCELGGVYALRAHLYIRDSGLATIRLLLDLTKTTLAVALIIVLLLASSGILREMCGTVIVLIVAIVWTMRLLERNAAGALEFCTGHPESWWMRDTSDLPKEYGLWTPWKKRLPANERSHGK